MQLSRYNRIDLVRLEADVRRKATPRREDTDAEAEIIDVARYEASTDQWAIRSLCRAHGIPFDDVTQIVAVGQSLYFWVLERNEEGARFIVGEGGDAYVAYRVERRPR